MRERRGFEIDVELHCELEGQPVLIRTVGEKKLVCSLPNVRTLIGLRRLSRRLIPLRKVGLSLKAIQHTLEVQVDGGLVARFGGETRGRLLPFFGFHATELRLRRLFCVAVKGSRQDADQPSDQRSP